VFRRYNTPLPSLPSSIYRVHFVLNFRFNLVITLITTVSILTTLLLVLSPLQVRADVLDCELIVSPTTTTRETGTTYEFDTIGSSFTGSGARWVKITRPSTDYTITGGASSGWEVSHNGTDITFTHSTQIDPGLVTFVVQATSGSSDAGPHNWKVQMSDMANGAFAKTCRGSLESVIAGISGVSPTPTLTPSPTPDTTAPTISEVFISGVSDSSVTVSWETSELANSRVNYGTSTNYDSWENDLTMKTRHTLLLVGLSENTTYHAQIQSSDAAGNVSSSSDFTFTTIKEEEYESVDVDTFFTSTDVEQTPTPEPTPTPDLTAPTVRITSPTETKFTTSPTFHGTATDNEAISIIEYSFDNGENWSEVEIEDSDDFTQVDFSFTPLLPGEGNYFIMVRAYDESENVGESEPQLLVLDRLPPAVGGNILTIGPHVIQPDEQGQYVVVAGVSLKLTLSAIGGPTQIELLANDLYFPMTQNVQTRLWSTELKLEEVGTYQLKTRSVDGAGNETTKVLNPIKVVPGGVISGAHGPLDGARLAVYVFDDQLRQFRLWRADQFGQENPQLTDKAGQYRLILPPGMYYLHMTGPYGQSLKTKIFTLSQNTPIVHHFTLRKPLGVSLGNLALPFVELGQHDVMMEFASQHSVTNVAHQVIHPLVNQPFIDLELDGVQTRVVSGKPMIISVLTQWLPQTAAQMSVN
jgi:hypothetical protein